MNMATYKRPPWSRTKAALRFTGEAVIAAMWLGIIWASLVLASVIEETPPPETREFTTAVHSENYSRTQRDWGDN